MFLYIMTYNFNLMN